MKKIIIVIAIAITLICKAGFSLPKAGFANSALRPKATTTSTFLIPELLQNGFRVMQETISLKLKQFKEQEITRPLLVVICGQPSTAKTAITGYIQQLRFGLRTVEIMTFQHDEQRSMLSYNYTKSGDFFHNLKLIIVEGYNTIPYWAEKENPDLVIEFVTEDVNIRRRRIAGHGWGENRIKELAAAPRIPYDKIELAINTSDLSNFTETATLFLSDLGGSASIGAEAFSQKHNFVIVHDIDFAA